MGLLTPLLLGRITVKYVFQYENIETKDAKKLRRQEARMTQQYTGGESATKRWNQHLDPSLCTHTHNGLAMCAVY